MQNAHFIEETLQMASAHPLQNPVDLKQAKAALLFPQRIRAQTGQLSPPK